MTTENPKHKSARNLYYIFGGLLAVIAVIIIIVMTSGSGDDDHYSIGVNYIKEKNYDAALAELEKIQPSDRDYIDAAAKINFVKGIQLYKQDRVDEAYQYLVKVNSSDQFYPEAKNYVIEIEQMSPKGSGEITEADNSSTQLSAVPTDTTETIEVDLKLKSLAVSMIDSMKKFEELYVQSEIAQEGFDKYKSSLTLLRNNFDKLNTNVSDADLKKLGKHINEWMSILIKYLDTKILEMSGIPPPSGGNLRDIKRESFKIRNEIEPLISAVRNRYRIL